MKIKVKFLIDRQAHRQTNRHRQTDRHRQANRQADRQIGRRKTEYCLKTKTNNIIDL